MPPEKLKGKAIVLIWSEQRYPAPQKVGYADINCITGKFADPEKFRFSRSFIWIMPRRQNCYGSDR